DGEVAAADQAFGELVALFRAHRPEGTVILTADHGEEFGDHGGHYHGTTVYDEQVRVPFLWSSPGEVTPGTTDAPVELVDIATTLLSALGIPRGARMRGDDLGPVLANADAEGPRFAFSEVSDARMMTDGRFKTICAIGSGVFGAEAEAMRCRLYDLANDPNERVNVASEHPDETRALRSAIHRLIASIPRV